MTRPSKRGRCWTGAAAALLALALALAGCAGGPIQPKPGDASLELVLQAQAQGVAGKWWSPRPEQINWDVGVYRVGEDGKLIALYPASGRSLTVLSGNPLRLAETFYMPPGRHRLKVIAEAYFFRPQGEGVLPVTLANFGVTEEATLAAGGARKITISFR